MVCCQQHLEGHCEPKVRVLPTTKHPDAAVRLVLTAITPAHSAHIQFGGRTQVDCKLHLLLMQMMFILLCCAVLC
jgi:hypothetical protein